MNTNSIASSFETDLPVPIAFDVPTGWMIKSVRGHNQCFTAMLIARSNAGAIGTMCVEVHAGDDVPYPIHVVREYSSRLQTRGYHVAGAPVLNVPGHSGCTETWYYQPEVMINGVTFEAPTLIFLVRQSVVLAGLVTPRKQDRSERQMFNKIAFRTLQRSLRVQ